MSRMRRRNLVDSSNHISDKSGNLQRVLESEIVVQTIKRFAGDKFLNKIWRLNDIFYGKAVRNNSWYKLSCDGRLVLILSAASPSAYCGVRIAQTG